MKFYILDKDNEPLPPEIQKTLWETLASEQEIESVERSNGIAFRFPDGQILCVGRELASFPPKFENNKSIFNPELFQGQIFDVIEFL